MQRTTIMLDEDSRQAARELALRFACSTSEAIRRAIMTCREQYPLGRFTTPEERTRRTQALRTLIEISDGADPQAEIDELKRVDAES